MKKILLAAAVATATLMPLSAQETVKTLYNGEAVDVTWANPLYITADKFAEDVKTGDYINVTLENATDVIEFKADGKWIPGSKLTNINGAADTKIYLTDAGLAAIKEYGLEIIGASFTVKEVSVMNDGFVMPEGAIWGGYFWVDNWNTLELFKTAFDNYSGQRYMDVYLSADNGDFTGYFMKVLTAWNNPAAEWADNAAITHEAGKAIIDLKDINVKEALATVDKLLIQSNPEGGNPYNLTAVVLREDPNLSSVNSIIASDNSLVDVYNLQGMAVKTAVEAADATAGLPAGLYIVGGKKIYVK